MGCSKLDEKIWQVESVRKGQLLKYSLHRATITTSSIQSYKGVKVLKTNPKNKNQNQKKKKAALYAHL